MVNSTLLILVVNYIVRLLSVALDDFYHMSNNELKKRGCKRVIGCTPI